MSLTSGDDVHDRVAAELWKRLHALEERRTPRSSALHDRRRSNADAESAELRADQGLLHAHWEISPLVAGEQPLSDACGQPQPCSHVQALAKKYLRSPRIGDQ